MSRGIRKQERQVGEAGYGAVRTLTVEHEGGSRTPPGTQHKNWQRRVSQTAQPLRLALDALYAGKPFAERAREFATHFCMFPVQFLLYCKWAFVKLVDIIRLCVRHFS